ncbi:sensor histidine kinase [Psychrobium sp. nBUS_13]|uniref:sensor histidine kinase n=1 Tax=Psychrobium sp. nBUS_13 TaxID=3395319 RepID=UPI003EBD417B
MEDLVYSIQEGISNAIRHGEATTIDIEITHQEAGISIALIDNGRPEQSQTTFRSKFGNGLTGMKERLSQYNAQINLSQNKKNGFTLTIALPMAQCVTNHLDVNN